MNRLQRKVICLASFILLLSINALSQTGGFYYQAVARDAGNQPLANTNLGVEIRILKSNPEGVPIWEESRQVSTNDLGLFSLTICGPDSNPTGGLYMNPDDIEWGTDDHFLNIRIDAGSGFVDMGTVLLLSVPYALYAKEAHYAEEAKSLSEELPETDPVFSESVAAGISATDTINWNARLEAEADPVFSSWDKTSGIAISKAQISDLGSYLETETDPMFSSWDKTSGITINEAQISDMGNYLEAEADPVFNSWDKTSGITISEAQISDMGNYLEAEADPVFSSWDKTSGITISEAQISDLGNYLETESQDLNQVLVLGSDAGSQVISNLGSPVMEHDAATKAYVDVLQRRITLLEEVLRANNLLNPDDTLNEVYQQMSGANLLEDTDYNSFMQNADSTAALLIPERTVSYDSVSDVSTITISVEPVACCLEDLNLVEYIPKEIAASIEDIEFDPQPTKVINEDPLIMWHFGDLSEKVTVKYKVKNKITSLIPAKEYHISSDYYQRIYQDLPTDFPEVELSLSGVTSISVDVNLNVISRGTVIKKVYLWLKVNGMYRVVYSGEGAGDRLFTLEGLSPDTDYELNAAIMDEKYFWNEFEKHALTTFSGPSSGTFTDLRDGQEYAWVNIGGQIWMAENLAISDSYVSGLTYISTSSDWINTTGAAYTWPNFIANSSWAQLYGAFYNQAAIETGDLCPDGWHIPTAAEFGLLVDYCGGYETAGEDLKSTNHWLTNNGTDAYGFNGLPAGYQHSSLGGTFAIGGRVSWWTTSSFRTLTDDSDYVYNNSSTLNDNTHFGGSVRCIKD